MRFDCGFSCPPCDAQVAWRSIVVVLAVAALPALVACEDAAAEEAPVDNDFAQLVLHKALKLDSDYMVVAKNFTVTYTLYNVGTRCVVGRPGAGL